MTHRFTPARLLQYIFLILAAFVSLFPFIFMLIGTTNESTAIRAGTLSIGDKFVDNITMLFGNELFNFLPSLGNSAIIAGITTVLALLISSSAGYGFEIYHSRKREVLFNFLLVSMMIPTAVLMIPLFKLFSHFGGTPLAFMSLNTKSAVIIPFLATAFLIFFFRQNVKSFPRDLLEAARIDGVSELGIFFKIFIPTNKNTYAAAGIITFMTSWNNYLWPLVALQSQDQYTAPLILAAMGASYTPEYGMIMCAIVLTTLPTAVLFFVLQRQFVQGMLGSVK